jgi:hypothetical protein
MFNVQKKDDKKPNEQPNILQKMGLQPKEEQKQVKK